MTAKFVAALGLVAALACSGTAAAAGTLEAGQAKSATCMACHGADGIAVVADAPNLAGENTIYIDSQLKAFRSGKREHEVMSEIAAGLDDAAIRAAAEWYAAIGLDITGP